MHCLQVSGPEVAASLTQWMKNHDERRKAEVERVAERMKEELMDNNVLDANPSKYGVVRQMSKGREDRNEELLKGSKVAVVSSKNDDGKDISTCNTTVTSNGDATPPICDVAQEAQNGVSNNNNDISSNAQTVSPSRLQTKYNAATLTNVTGDDLAREVRQILIGQRTAAMATISEPPSMDNSAHAAEESDVDGKAAEEKNAPTKPVPSTAASVQQPAKKKVEGTLFCGIDDAARASRQKELRAIRLSQLEDETGVIAEDVEEVGPPQIRKKLRWHALVDSGMGRLGFKTDADEPRGGGDDVFKPDPQARLEGGVVQLAAADGVSDGSMSSSDHSSTGIRDTVSIIKDLYDAEVHEGAPIGKWNGLFFSHSSLLTSNLCTDNDTFFLHRILRVVHPYG